MATDLQTRKLNLITYIAEFKDEEFFEEIEGYILKKDSEIKDSDFTPFAIEELIKRIKMSEKDYENGRIKSQEEIEKESINW